MSSFSTKNVDNVLDGKSDISGIPIQCNSSLDTHNKWFQISFCQRRGRDFGLEIFSENQWTILEGFAEFSAGNGDLAPDSFGFEVVLNGKTFIQKLTQLLTFVGVLKQIRIKII